MTEPTPEDLQQLVDASSNLYSLGEEWQRIYLQARMLSQKMDTTMESITTAVPVVVALLRMQGYVGRGTCTVMEGFPRYAVHPDWVVHYDAGLYNTDTQTWDASLGEVPNWALLRIQP